MARIVDVLK